MQIASENPEYRHRKNSVALARLPKADFDLHRGEYAIVVDGKIESFHKTNREAIVEARRKFGGAHFSVRRVEPQPVDVGFIDLADYHR